MFEDAFGKLGHLPVPDVDATNKAYDGWFTTTKNLFFANGHRAYLFTLPPSLPVPFLNSFPSRRARPHPAPWRGRGREGLFLPLRAQQQANTRACAH